jgi:lactose/L-arabinose transport system permease protein
VTELRGAPLALLGGRRRAAAARRRSTDARRARPGMWFALPAVGLLAVFFAYPLLASLWQSLTVSRGGVTEFAGLANYQRLLADPLIAKSLGNAVLILALQVPLMIALALVLAALLDQSWLRFRSGFRVIHFLPAVTTLVAYSMVFRVLLAPDGGAMNQLIGLVGIAPVDWLHHDVWAKVAVIASVTWRWTGYNMVIILAGMQAIPRELTEAAAIDGANRWQTFWRVIVPQLRPVLIFTTVTSTIGALQLFDENYILTGGGPSNATLTPVLYLYKTGFERFDFGYASAIAWMLVVIIAVISLVQFRIMREKP